MKKKIVHYLNQFFGGLGGEEMADAPAQLVEGCVGAGKVLQQMLGDDIEIVATIICGDNYINEANKESALLEITNWVKNSGADLLFAGPAFESGRYGLACGAVCQAVGKELNIPCVASMSAKNPALDMYYMDAYIIESSDKAAQMGENLQSASKLIEKLLSGEQMGSAKEEGYVPRGYRRIVFSEKIGAVRAVDMVLAKIAGAQFETEVELPQYGNVTPAPAIKNIKEATVAIASTSGVVALGNPQKLESVRCTKWAPYSTEDIEGLDASEFECIHGGFYVKYACEDPNRAVPLDALKELEREGAFGRLYPIFYAYNGAMAVLENGKRVANEMIADMKQNGVDAVILTST